MSLELFDFFPLFAQNRTKFKRQTASTDSEKYRHRREATPSVTFCSGDSRQTHHEAAWLVSSYKHTSFHLPHKVRLLLDHAASRFKKFTRYSFP